MAPDDGKEPPLKRRANILLLGDSITQLSFSASDAGWGAHLADVYQRRADVLNRGKSGYNSDWFLHYLRTADGYFDVFGDGEGGKREHVRLVTIFFGANDSSSSELNERQHVPLDRYKSNLKEIASIVRNAVGEHVKIVIICPPPVHHDSRLEFQIKRYGKDKATGKLERTMNLSGKYANAAAEVANEIGAPCLNLWKDMQDAKPPTEENNETWSAFLSDGLHLSRDGNIFVGEELVKLIEKEFPGLAITPCPHTGFTGNSGSACQELEKLGPWHDHIDKDVGKAFREDKKRKRVEEDDG